MKFTVDEVKEIIIHTSKYLYEISPNIHNDILISMEIKKDLSGLRDKNMNYNPLIKYFEKIISRLKELSNVDHNPMLNRFNEFVKTENGKSIQGIKMTIDDKYQQFIDSDEIDLSELPKNNKLIDRIEELINALKDEEDDYSRN